MHHEPQAIGVGVVPMSGMYDQGDGPAGGGPYRQGDDDSDYGLSVFRTLDRPIRLTLYRLLAVPLAVGLLLALHPWTWGGSSHSGTPGFDSGFQSSVGNAPEGDSGHTDPAATGTYDPGTYDPGTADPGGSGPETTDPGTGTPEPSPTVDASGQASELDSLISQSADSRGQVSTAVTDAEQCGPDAGLSSDATALQTAADSRSSLAQQADGLTLDMVPGGPNAAQLLSTALSLSAAADTDYANWATALGEGTCTPGSTHDQSAYKTGGADSAKAQKAKADFIAVWNPIASQYNLPTRTADEF